MAPTLEAGLHKTPDDAVGLLGCDEIRADGERFNGNLQRRHLREDTPYNTYVHRGLPPTPIGLPGARSISAALHPAPGEFLYFVSRGDGSSQFSTSLAEHQAAVRKYQLR